MSKRQFIRGLTALAGACLMTVSVTGCGFVSMSARGTWVDSSGDVVLTFTQEGLIMGTDGCNSVEGTWEEHGDEVTLTLGIDKANDCSGVDVWLTNPTNAIIDGTTMQIFGPNDSLLGELMEQE